MACHCFRMKEKILRTFVHSICRYGMLKLDRSNTHLKVMRLQYTLFALITKRTFRYFLDDFISGILKIWLHVVLAAYLLFWLLSISVPFS